MTKMLLLLTLFLAGCGGEEITGNFTLEAADGFVYRTNYETPHTYIIESNNEKVFVERYVPGFTDEEREAFGEMTPEEQNEFIDNQPVVEDPIYDITVLNATKDKIVLEYENERLVFTALSDSYFKDEDGTWYIVDYNSNNIQGYLNSKISN